MVSLIKKLLTLFTVLIILNVGFVWYGQANFEATVKSLGKAFVENNTSLTVAQKLPVAIEQYVNRSNFSQNSYSILALQFDGEFRPKPSKSMKMHTLALLRPAPDMLLGIRLESNFIVTFNAIETYQDAQANMQMLLFGIVPIGEFNDEKFTRSELAKLLAYSVFNPALLKNRSVKYELLDETHTKATIVDGKIKASVIFVSDKNGKIIEIQSSDRFRTVNKKLQNTLWKMKILSYGKYDGLNLPKYVEEVWVEEGEEFTFSRYSLTSAKRL